MEESVDSEWALMAVSTSGAPASLRVHVWRKLKGLGALYIQQSVVMLPARHEVLRELTRLVDRAQRQDAVARLMHVTLNDPVERARLAEEMNTARDGEYREVLERLPAFFAELAEERARGRATYAEVEESEADLGRFRSWMDKIAGRDYFSASVGAEARARIEAAGRELEAFEQAAFSADTPGDLSGATGRGLDKAHHETRSEYGEGPSGSEGSSAPASSTPSSPPGPPQERRTGRLRAVDEH